MSTTPLAVSEADARRALLRHQLAPGSLDEVVRRLGSVQVDPLAPMGRNHDLVLQARVDGYRIDDWQRPAYRDRSWFDAWDKQACLTLSAEWPARRLYRDHFAAGRATWMAEHADAVAATLARIETEGPRSSLGLEGASSDRLRGSWYGPRMIRHVLPVLWHTGQLVTREREAGRHVYDLPERVLPPEVLAAPALDDASALRTLLLRRVQSAGALRRAADASLWSLAVTPAVRRAALAALVEDGGRSRGPTHWEPRAYGWASPASCATSARTTSRSRGASTGTPGRCGRRRWPRRARDRRRARRVAAAPGARRARYRGRLTSDPRGARMNDAANPSAAPETSRTAAVLARAAAHAPGLWSPDVVFVRGEGARLYDADGRGYLDGMAGIAVASVGHGNARLADAIATQARRLIVCPQNLGNDVRTAFVDKLFAHLPAPLSRVFLANSGAEVNEAALKWAWMATGRRRVVAAKRGFAGRTLGALAMTWEAKYREPFEPLSVPVDFVRYDDRDELEAAVGDDTAMIWLEPIQGEGGVHLASAAYLRRARELADERGALLAFDEIQCGVGRTGRFLASEHAGVVPDVVTLAKGLGGGVPIGALVMTDAVAEAMPAGGHGTTFGGNPLAAAAGLAVLEEIEARDLMAHAERMGRRFRAGIEALGSPRIREVRGLGLMLGVELEEKAAPVIAALREEGLLLINAGTSVIRFVPPLVIGEDEVDEAVAAFGRVLR